MPHKITLTGQPCSPLRSCGESVFSFDMEEGGSGTAPKGLPLSKPISYTVFVNKKQIKKAHLENENIQEITLIVQGEPTLDIPMDECPGEIGLICFSLSIMPRKEAAESNAPESTIVSEEIKQAVEQIAVATEVKPEGTDVIIPLTAISVPEDFFKTTPNKRKTQQVIEYVQEHGHLDEPICVEKETLVLVDGYRRYLVAQSLKMTHVPVVYI